MSISDICRVCLSGCMRLYTIRNTVFQEIWERLTNSMFTTDDGKPLFVCYICYAQLKKSHELRKRALKAEKLLTTIINNGSENSRKAILLIASLTNDLDYNYSIKKVDQFECKHLETNTVKEIKKENEGRSEEDNEEEEKDINIKEEEKDWPESHQEENLDITNVESDTLSGDDKPLKKALEKQVRIILEKIDMGAPARERKLNEVPQKAKRIKLEETTKDRKPLINVLKRLPKNNFKASDISLSRNLSMNSNMKITISKQNINSKINCYQVTKISPEVNILPKLEIQAKNVIVQNDRTLTSEVNYINAENDTIKQCYLKSANTITPSTSLDRNTEGNKSNMCNIKSKNDFTCLICRYKFITNTALSRHLPKHTGEKPFICDLCDYRCAHEDDLIKDIKCKHTKKMSYSCHTCQYKCVTKNELNRHLRNHLKVESYICDLCDYRCAQKYKLIIHKRIQHVKKRGFSCHICQYKCDARIAFENHFRTHTGEKPYTCDFCDYRCAQKGRLDIHVKFKHTKERNFTCYVCQFKFVTKSDLDMHLRKHTGEKPYTCDRCDYRCARKEHLIVHVKRKHTNEKNFSCDICQHKFVTKSSLIVHLRIHTGVTPYKCQFCSFKCSSHSTLSKHTKSRHTK